MSKAAAPEIHFLRVTDTTTKLNRIVNTVSEHYLSGERVVIFVPNEQAATYIDELLWRMPQDSFLPHAIAESGTEESVAITRSERNVNRAKIALNLSPGLCKELESFEKVYELSDQTDPKKAKQSQEKLLGYQKLGLFSHP